MKPINYCCFIAIVQDILFCFVFIFSIIPNVFEHFERIPNDENLKSLLRK